MRVESQIRSEGIPGQTRKDHGEGGLVFPPDASTMPVMLPDLQSSLLCDDVRQETNGKFILIGIFDYLSAPQMPIRYPRLFMVNRWCSGEGQFNQRSRILKPDQTTPLISGQAIPVRLQDPLSSATNVEVFYNVQFNEPGAYWVEILIDDQLKVRYPLRVALLRPPHAQGAQTPPPPPHP